MAVLSNIDIQEAIENDEGIIILNRREKSITGAGYDLTIGFIRDADTGELPETCADDENRYTLLAGHRYLVISKEFIYISSQYMAVLHSRGSYALKGIIVTSTTVDPNYAGCIAGSLINCSSADVHIKKNNQFATMVIHKLCTPTTIYLQKNEEGRYMDTQETLHGKYSNIHPKACKDGDAYYGEIRKLIEYEYMKARERIFAKKKRNGENISKGEVKQEKLESEASYNKEKEVTQTDSQRKKICFLIGNGFDINVGLKTKYADFYEYYKNMYKDDMLAQEIRGASELWSDLELAIGKVTEKISSLNKEEFWESEERLENSLLTYLEEQMRRVDLREEGVCRKIRTEMQKSLTEFYEELNEKEKEELKRIIPNNREHIECGIISFNYTDVFDQCIRIMLLEHWIHLYTEGSEKVLHIHGTISNSMVLGVNDESQIVNKEFADDISVRERLIKKDINETVYRNKKIDRAYETINKSDLICIFGMSIGSTDKMWWQYIAKWLQRNEERRLIIFVKGNEISKVEKFAIKFEREMREKFRKNGELDSAVWEQIEDRIYVEVNVDIFNFKVV